MTARLATSLRPERADSASFKPLLADAVLVLSSCRRNIDLNCKTYIASPEVFPRAGTRT